MNRFAAVADQLRAVWMLAIVATGLIIATPLFQQPTNLLNILITAAVVTLLAIGQTYVIILAEIDLSVGAVLGFSAMSSAMVMREHGPLVGLAVGLAVGAGAGLVNGLLVTKTRMPSFIATLATMSIFSGLALQLSQGNPVGVASNAFLAMGQGKILGIANPIWIMLVVAVVAGYVLARTRFGRELYATGDNAEAARLSGISVDRVKILAFMISGLLAAIAGFILTARLGTAQPTAGNGLELAAIAAVIIGGTSLAGGRGAIVGTFIGGILLATIDNGLNLLNVSPFLQSVVKGLVILIAVYLDRNSGALARVFKSSRAGRTVNRPNGKYVLPAIAVVAILVIATVSILSRGVSTASETKSATLVISTLNNPFFVSVADGAKSQAAAGGMELDVQNANNDDTAALNQATTALVKQPDVLILDPTSSESGGSIVEQANAAEVPVVAFDRMPDKGQLRAFIGYDAVEAGRNGAKALCEAVGGTGNVAEVQGILGTSVARDRSKGFREGMQDCPGVKIVATQTANFDRGKSLDVTNNILQANPNLDGIYAANDEMALGSVAAVKSRNLVGKVQIVGNDGIADALTAVKSGQMYATNAESPFALGQEVVRIASEVAAGNDVNPEQVLQGRVVVKADVPEFCDYLIGLGDTTTCK
jgi:ribose transport system substrate-binding protein